MYLTNFCFHQMLHIYLFTLLKLGNGLKIAIKKLLLSSLYCQPSIFLKSTVHDHLPNIQDLVLSLFPQLLISSVYSRPNLANLLQFLNLEFSLKVVNFLAIETVLATGLLGNQQGHVWECEGLLIECQFSQDLT